MIVYQCYLTLRDRILAAVPSEGIAPHELAAALGAEPQQVAAATERLIGEGKISMTAAGLLTINR